jgi:ketosteroid isomerase-like protein
MSAEENVQTAKDGYAAFGREDLPGILELLTDDIEWVNPGPPDVIPGAGKHVGKDAVAGFFGTLAQSTDFQAFEPREFIAQGDKVVALIHSEATARSTGRKFVDHEAHVWTFRDGKVAHFQVFQDTAALVAAFGEG